jgi:hypothetical protein
MAGDEIARQKILVEVIEDQYDANGVDRSLTRIFLQRTSLECLEILEDMNQLIESAKPCKTDSSR